MGLSIGQTSNPLRRPDVLMRIRAMVDIDPVAATGSVIIDLVKREFGISVTRNQVSGALSREGIKRGGYSALTGKGRANKRLVDDGTLTEKQKCHVRIRDGIGQSLVSPTPIELDRAAIREQQRVLKASILAVPRALTVAPRERPTRAVRAPEVTLAAVVKSIHVAPRYGRVVECSFPIGEPGAPGYHSCDKPSESGRVYCPEHIALCYVKVRDRREDRAIDADAAD